MCGAAEVGGCCGVLWGAVELFAALPSKHDSGASFLGVSLFELFSKEPKREPIVWGNKPFKGPFGFGGWLVPFARLFLGGMTL